MTFHFSKKILFATFLLGFISFASASPKAHAGLLDLTRDSAHRLLAVHGNVGIDFGRTPADIRVTSGSLCADYNERRTCPPRSLTTGAVYDIAAFGSKGMPESDIADLSDTRLTAKAGTLDILFLTGTLDLDGNAIIRVSKILSENGKWSIDEDGTLVVAKVITRDLTVTDLITVGSSQNPSGITLYDEATGKPYCVKVKNGTPRPEPGECESSHNPDSLVPQSPLTTEP